MTKAADIYWALTSMPGIAWSALHAVAHSVLTTTIWGCYSYPHLTGEETELTRVHVVNHMPYCQPREKTMKGEKFKAEGIISSLKQEGPWLVHRKESSLADRAGIWDSGGLMLHRTRVSRVRSLGLILNAVENCMRISNREMTFCWPVAVMAKTRIYCCF